jgi:hypothetical protein
VQEEIAGPGTRDGRHPLRGRTGRQRAGTAAEELADGTAEHRRRGRVGVHDDAGLVGHEHRVADRGEHLRVSAPRRLRCPSMRDVEDEGVVGGAGPAVVGVGVVVDGPDGQLDRHR